METSKAIILGALIIAIAILISGGVIKLDKLGIKGNPSPSPIAGGPNIPTAPVAKGVDSIVATFKAEAGKLGLDQDKFDKCLDSGEKALLVTEDLNAGEKVGINGTPGFFLNGFMINGSQPLTVFKDAIDFLSLGGDFNNPSEKVKYLLDGNENNGEISKTKQEVEVGNLPALGSMGAPVTMIEFSDYQCPYCGRYYTQTEIQLKKDYIDSGKVKFYYRDFPLSSIHPAAQKGAEAARCAGDQNKYWEYHDILFQNQASIFQ